MKTSKFGLHYFKKALILNLLGYDIMLDANFKPHLLEVNGRPSIYDEVLDNAVNKPMVEEMFRVVGYHVPKVAAMGNNLFPLSKMFKVKPNLAKNMVYENKFYTKRLNEEDLIKQAIFKEKCERGDWLGDWPN
jgi:hypothetical protein